MDVIKADRTRERFNEDKLKRSVEKAMVDSGRVNRAVVNRVVNAVKAKTKNKRDVTTKEIRRNVLQKLGTLNPRARTAWQKFERKYKRARTAQRAAGLARRIRR
jgi:transcriptional regulator NrdR family protein